MITRLFIITCIMVNTISGMQSMDQSLLDISNEIISMRVKLPSAEHIRNNLYKGGYAPFYNNTYIDLHLGNKEYDLITLSNIVGRHIYYYVHKTTEDVKNQIQHVGMHVSEPMSIDKNEILRRILYDMPEAYKKLREYEAKINNRAYYRSKPKPQAKL